MNKDLISDIRQSGQMSGIENFDIIKNDIPFENVEEIIINLPTDSTLSQLEAYWALNEAEEGTEPHDKILSLLTSKKSVNTAVVCQLIETYIDYLQNNINDKFKSYGEVIAETYLTRHPQSREDIKIKLGINSDQIFYRLRNNGIALLSQMLFGIDPGANGFVDILIDGNQKLIFPKFD